jgi:small conductance mechanosensitive channel
MNIDLSPALRKIDAMMDGLVAAIPNAVLSIIVLAVFVLVAKWTGILVRRLVGSRLPSQNLAIVFGRLLNWMVLLLGLLVALSIMFPSFGARDLIQFLGIGTVAIGFAFRDVLQNFLAGIILLLTHPFRIGDEIALDKVEGTVQDIETRATLVRTYDGILAVIPNASILTQNVVVNTAFQSRRAVLELQIDQNENVDGLRSLLMEAIEGVDGVLPDPPPKVEVADLSPGAWRIRVTWWTLPIRKEWVAVRSEVIPAIKDKLAAAGKLPSGEPGPVAVTFPQGFGPVVDEERAEQRTGERVFKSPRNLRLQSAKK